MVANDVDVTELGLFLQRLYRRAGKNKSQFAEAIGVKWSTVQNWFKPSKSSVPDGGTVAKIVKALALSPEEQAKLNELVRTQQEKRDARPRTTKKKSRTVRLVPRYMNAELALDDLRADGVVVPDAVADDVIEGVGLASRGDHPIPFWRAAFKRQLELRSTYKDATIEQIRQHLGAVEAAEDPGERPRRGKR